MLRIAFESPEYFLAVLPAKPFFPRAFNIYRKPNPLRQDVVGNKQAQKWYNDHPSENR